MYVRLAFAVAAHIEPEILVVDEVLAVGDAQFQTKCLGKMQDVARDGRTVLIVSHNMPMLKSLCTRTIVLSAGAVVNDADVESGIQTYLSGSKEVESDLSLANRKDRMGDGRLRFREAYLLGAAGVKNVLYMGEEVRIVLKFSAFEPIRKCDISIHVDNAWGQVVLRLATRETAVPFNDVTADGTITCTVPKLRLLPGKYHLLLAASVPPAFEYLDYVSHAVAFEIVEDDVYGTGRVPEFGSFFSECDWALRSGNDQEIDSSEPGTLVGRQQWTARGKAQAITRFNQET
jgi:lipopolysaccharide transport system ATP-binding protein